MKQLMTIIIAFMSAISAKSASVADMPSDSKQLAYSMKVGWNLGNSLESYDASSADSETSWGNPRTTQAMIDAVKASGFNAIRIPVRWYPHFTYNNGTVTIDAAWLSRVKQVIGYCLNDGMYVIMNTHHELWMENHATYADSASVFAKERALWTALATAFGDYDEHLLFAGTNEVHLDGVWTECTTENAMVQNKFNQIFINQVRATGGKNQYRNLVVQTYACNFAWGIDHFTVPKDPTPSRMIIEVHAYEPYDYAMNEAEPYKYWGAPYQSYGIESWAQEAYLDGIFNKMKTNFVDKGYPVIMGECGAIRHTSPTSAMNDSRAYFLKTFISKAKTYGVVPFFWDNGSTGTGKETYGLFNRYSNMAQIDNFSVSAIMQGAETSYPSVSGIETIKNVASENYNVYNQCGVMVKKNAKDLNGLPNGLYIVNGKKYVVK